VINTRIRLHFKVISGRVRVIPGSAIPSRNRVVAGYWSHLYFRIITLTYKMLYSGQPACLREFISPYQPSHSLRSSNQLLLTVPCTGNYGYTHHYLQTNILSQMAAIHSWPDFDDLPWGQSKWERDQCCMWPRTRPDTTWSRLRLRPKNLALRPCWPLRLNILQKTCAERKLKRTYLEDEPVENIEHLCLFEYLCTELDAHDELRKCDGTTT